MKLNLKMTIVMAFCVVTLNACSSASPSTTPPPTRLATQTPWIIYVPVTTTPEPATVTPLPTATEAKPTVRATATRAPVVSKPVATATKPPVAVAPTATPLPPCPPGLAFPSQERVRFPENGALRRTKTSGPGSDTFDFKWIPFQQGETDGQLGYRIEIQSKRGTQVVNGDVVDIQHNWFINNDKHYVYDARRVYNLASAGGGDSVTVTWSVSIIKATGGYSNQGQASGTVVKCGDSLPAWLIDLQVVD